MLLLTETILLVKNYIFALKTGGSLGSFWMFDIGKSCYYKQKYVCKLSKVTVIDASII